MCFLINAWLEQRDPYIEIIDKSQRRAVLYLHGDALRALFEDGVIELADLQSNDSLAHKQLVWDVLLYSCESARLRTVNTGVVTTQESNHVVLR